MNRTNTLFSLQFMLFLTITLFSLNLEHAHARLVWISRSQDAQNVKSELGILSKGVSDSYKMVSSIQYTLYVKKS